jgi:hypothetical protein
VAGDHHDANAEVIAARTRIGLHLHVRPRLGSRPRGIAGVLGLDADEVRIAVGMTIASDGEPPVLLRMSIVAEPAAQPHSVSSHAPGVPPPSAAHFWNVCSGGSHWLRLYR